MLNILWPIFIILSISFSIVNRNLEDLNKAITASTESAVTLTLTLIGSTCLWSGIMEIASNTKIVNILSSLLKVIINKFFQNINKNENAEKKIIMNIIANILGLGNAATPLGLEAMKELQKENIEKEKLSDNMMMLIILNTASLQIIPTTVIAIRTALNSENPTKIIFPVWISTICAGVVGIVMTKLLIKVDKN